VGAGDKSILGEGALVRSGIDLEGVAMGNFVSFMTIGLSISDEDGLKVGGKDLSKLPVPLTKLG
jgi:hypothetical protein